jgi:hypothetical protein
MLLLLTVRHRPSQLRIWTSAARVEQHVALLLPLLLLL